VASAVDAEQDMIIEELAAIAEGGEVRVMTDDFEWAAGPAGLPDRDRPHLTGLN